MSWRRQLARRAMVQRLPRSIRSRFSNRALIPANITTTVRDYERITAAATDHGLSVEGKVVLEIGSGWYPTIPILLARDGASVIATDLEPHLEAEGYDRTLVLLRDQFPDDAALQCLGSLAEVAIDYWAPFAPDQLCDGSVDLIVSRTVLEHVPTADIVDLLAGLGPKLAPDGAMIHLVDHSDHLSHGDPDRSRVAFLEWTSRRHRVVNWLSKGGENRLRHHQYSPLFIAAGLDLVDEIARPNPRVLAQLADLDLAPPFDTMPADQLATTESVYVLRRAPAV